MPRRGIGLLALALVLSGCGSKQDALAPRSAAARGITSLWWDMLIGASLGLGLVALVLVMSWVHRRRELADAERRGWRVVLGLGFVIPILVLAALFLYSNIFLIRTTAPAAAAAQLQIRVIGHQFWWEARYPGTNAITANEIHIPVRTNVLVKLSTRDVIHSFWVPQLNKKVDMIPEQTNTVMLYADRPGRYRGQCAEFCGLQHAHMGFYVFADPPAAYRRWLTRESRPEKSIALFDEKCGSCHTIRGSPSRGTAGPDLTHVGSRTSLAALTIPNSPARMREWLHDPQRVKPGSAMPAVALTAAQLGELVAFLESRK